jgi:hypothetical protein
MIKAIRDSNQTVAPIRIKIWIHNFLKSGAFKIHCIHNEIPLQPYKISDTDKTTFVTHHGIFQLDFPRSNLDTDCIDVLQNLAYIHTAHQTENTEHRQINNNIIQHDLNVMHTTWH